MNVEELIQHLEAGIQSIEPGTLTAGTVFRDLSAWDSLTALSLLVVVNSEYNVTFSGNELRSCITVQNIFDLIAAKKS